MFRIQLLIQTVLADPYVNQIFQLLKTELWECEVHRIPHSHISEPPLTRRPLTVMSSNKSCSEGDLPTPHLSQKVMVHPGLSEQLPEGSLNKQYIKTAIVQNIQSKTTKM
jgi:hypothetical protein